MTSNLELPAKRVNDLDNSHLFEIVMGAPVTFVTGKGGVGKTTIASLLSQEAHSHGERVLFISLNRDWVTDNLIGIDEQEKKDIFRSKNFGFDVSFITPARALSNYLASKHMGSITNKLEKIGLLEMVANTIPGMRELLVIGDIRSKAESKKWDRIIVDAPSTGHARSLFNIHESTGLVASSGVVKNQSEAAKEFLRNRDSSQVVVVTLDHAMPLSEAKEFLFELEDDLEMNINSVIINKSDVASSKKSNAINKHLKNIFVPLYSYKDQNKKDKSKSIFQKLRNKHHIPKNLQKHLAFPSNCSTFITLGSGGVGKTTTAGAVSLSLAQSGNNVALLTIDPARRLGVALGFRDSTSIESHLDPFTFESQAKKDCTFHVYQLDTKKEFLSLLKSTLSEAEFKNVEENSFVSAVSSMGIVNEFMAIEAMHRLVNENIYDAVIIDTPPSHHVYDLLEAPQALERMTSSKIFKTIVGASSMTSITTNITLGTIFRPLKGIIGAQLVTDAIDFLRTFKDVEEEFTRHCTEVTEILERSETSFLVVCNPSSSSTEQAYTLVRGMTERNYLNISVLVNGIDLSDTNTLEEIENFANRLDRFNSDVTVFEEIELDSPLDIVKTMATKVESYS